MKFSRSISYKEKAVSPSDTVLGGNSIAKNGLKIHLKNGLKTRLKFLLTILSKRDLFSTAIPVLIQLVKKSA